MNVYKTRWFDRWARKEGLAVSSLCAAVHEIDKDETEALKKLATHLLSLTTQALDAAQRAGELIKVDCNA